MHILKLWLKNIHKGFPHDSHESGTILFELVVCLLWSTTVILILVYPPSPCIKRCYRNIGIKLTVFPTGDVVKD